MASTNLVSDKDVENLREIKRLLKEIKELDMGFDFRNVIEADNNTTLVFTTKNMLKVQYTEEYEKELTDKLQCKCIILPYGFNLDKAVKKENKQIDFETITFYADGEVIREETVQYK